MKNIAIGYFYNESFLDAFTACRDRIAEVFFAWPDVPAARPALVHTPEMRTRLIDDLRALRAADVRLDCVFNCCCYGDLAISEELAGRVTDALREMESAGILPDVVTTASPFIAHVLKRSFPSVRLRASVLLNINGTAGYAAAADLFDEYYLSLQRQRDFAYVRAVADWARPRGKTIAMLVNSGCIRECPYQTFHNNMHGHQRPRLSEAGRRFGLEVFHCKTWLDAHPVDFLKGSWIRPEDVSLWEPYVDLFKVSTRHMPNPSEILRAYATRSYTGNLARLTDIPHVARFPGKIIDNTRFPADWATSGIGGACAVNCTDCGRCAEIFNKVCVPADTTI